MIYVVNNRFRVITAVIVCFALAITVLAFSAAEHMYTRDMETRLARINAENANLARALEEFADSRFREADRILQFMKVEHEARKSLRPETLDLLRTFPGRLVNQIALSDPEGNLLFSAAPMNGTINIRNREHFRAQRDADKAGLHVALPIVAHSTGTSTIFLSRRLDSGDGGFAGVAAIGLDPDYFSRFFRQMALGRGSSVFVMRKDGAVLASTTQQNILLDTNVHQHEIFDRIRSGERAGVFEAPGLFSTATNLGAYRVLDGFPLVVAVSVLKDAALGEVHDRRAAYNLAALVAALITVVLSVALWRQFYSVYSAEASLRKTERDYHSLMENMVDGYFRTDGNGQIALVNSALVRMLGYRSAGAIVGRPASSLWADQRAWTGYAMQLLHNRHIADLSAMWRKKTGEGLPVSVSSHPYRGENGLAGTEGIVRDISERQKAEESLRYLSYHDGLTGLYNRFYFQGYLQELADRGTGSLGLLVVDVDGLKVVNETLGQEAGDVRLKTTAGILRHIFPDRVVARTGGDEFAVALPDVSEQELSAVAARLKKAVKAKSAGRKTPSLPLQLSTGYALARGPGYNVQELFVQADRHMYREKLRRAARRRGTLLSTLKDMLAARDYITEGHASRMQALTLALAEKAGVKIGSLLDIELFAQFHDIGKIGIPDAILNKQGPLDAEERKAMQLHTEIGHRIAKGSDELVPIADWILKHHERWDGKGYPLGLAGEEIPVECRILAIIDAYDAMTNDRPYRKAMPVEEAVAELKKCAGNQFDPKLVELFLAMLQDNCAA
jgi:diguanylate cyclase (GGDEF)-like protein/PAS domain S-box-containing protein